MKILVSYDIYRILVWQPTPALLPEKCYGQRSWWTTVHEGRKESDTTQRLNNNKYKNKYKLHSFRVKKTALLLIKLLKTIYIFISINHSSSVAQSCLTLCDPMNQSTPGLPVHHQLPEFTQTHVHRVCDAIQPSPPLSSPSPPALNLSQHQGLFK